MAFKYAIALTGSIATGKSSVASYFLEFGFHILDADKVAHQILDAHSKVIAKMFGKEMIENGKVNRKVLGKIVFGNIQKREMLESWIHPLIYSTIKKEADKLDRLEKPYLVDIPLFFEKKRYPIKKSIVVYAPKTEQLKRLMQRNGYNEEEALLRINAQMDIEEKRQKATYLIDNSYKKDVLKEACLQTKEEIMKDFK